MHASRRLLIGWLGLALSAPAYAALMWNSGPESVALERDGQVLWRFNFGPKETKPCFHPIALPGGPDLTWHRPADHRWHCALWFSWKYINGVNYWEEDAKTGLPAGRTEWMPPSVETRPDFSARIAMALSYRPAQGPALLRETRTIEVARPAADGLQQQDWTCVFTALDKEVKFDRTPLPNEPGGQVYGGYAGLSVRLVREWTDVKALTPTGAVAFAAGRFRGKASGLEYSGRVSEREYAVAILDHPKNLNAPSPWYVINDGPMRYFSPAVICYGPHTLPPKESFTLRYRVLIHPGRWTPERLQQEVDRYQRQP